VNQRSSTEFDARVERTWTLLSKLNSETTWVGPTGESGSGTNSRTTEYVYDASGRVSLIKYPDAYGNGDRTIVQRAYDGLNRVATILRKDPGGGSFVTIAAWAFQGPHRMTSLEFGNSVKETMSYDEYGRPSELYHDRLASTGTRRSMFFFKRSYDPGDRVTKERRNFWDNAGNPMTGLKDFGDIYGYDHQNRLATVVRSVGYTSHSLTAIDAATASTTDFLAKCAYNFDGAGNRKTLQYDSSNGTVTGAFGRDINGFDAENQLTSKAFYLYDQGQSTWSTTATTSATIVYDVNGNHISTNPTVKVDVHNRIYESGTWRYRYDPFGRRVEKRNTDTGGFWHRYYYEGVNRVAEYKIHLDSGQPAEFASGAMWVRIFGTYLVDQLLWVKLDPCGECGSYADGYMHLDFLGSVVTGTLAIGNGSGGYDVFEGYRYDEYGQPFFYDVFNTLGSASQVGQSHLYTGREWDAEMDGGTGRYYYRARYYDQTSGRFLSRDPAGADSFLNEYSYVGADPIQYSDPAGLQAINPASSPNATATYTAALMLAINLRLDTTQTHAVGCVLNNSKAANGSGGILCCSNVSTTVCCPVVTSTGTQNSWGGMTPNGAYLIKPFRKNPTMDPARNGLPSDLDWYDLLPWNDKKQKWSPTIAVPGDVLVPVPVGFTVVHVVARGLIERNAFGIHPGLRSLGCPAVRPEGLDKADIGKYNMDGCWQSLRAVLDSGSLNDRGESGVGMLVVTGSS
jgi:RHS repeat-associated protein